MTTTTIPFPPTARDLPTIAAIIRANFYAPDDPATAETLAHWGEIAPTLADYIDTDLRDMIHNGNIEDLIGTDAAAALDDPSLELISDFIHDYASGIASHIAMLLS